MSPERRKKPMEQIIREDGRYPLQAFNFLHQGMARAVKDVHGETPEHGRRHVSGQEICCALRDLAIERWGMLARTVLSKWSIHSTMDFGNMVYLLIEHGHYRKDDHDSIEDFRDVYDFDRAFDVRERFEVRE